VGQQKQNPQPAKKLHEHIRELLMRLAISFVALVLAGLVVYAFYEPVLALLRAPLGAPLYYSSPGGSFAFVMKICFMGALTITIPILIYNLIMFVKPAFEGAITSKRIYFTAGFSSILAIAGAAFAYNVILPDSLRFFAGFQVSGLNALISADSYLNFVTNMIVTFVIVFQLPLLITFIDSIKPLTPKKLLSFEKWVVLGSLVIALLAPFTYDLVTSLLIALPIIVLYNLSIFIVLAQHARSARKVRMATYAVVAKPVFKADFTLNDQVVNNLSDELAGLAKVAPVKMPALAPIQTIKPKVVRIDDMRARRSQFDFVKPAAMAIEKEVKRAVSTQVRLISDVRRNQNASRNLVLQ